MHCASSQKILSYTVRRKKLFIKGTILEENIRLQVSVILKIRREKGTPQLKRGGGEKSRVAGKRASAMGRCTRKAL